MKESKEFLGKLLGEHSRIRSSRTRPVIIAVMGTDRGVGTTHFCTAALNFLVNVRGLNVVMAELNMHPIIQHIINSGEEEIPAFILPFDRIQMSGSRYDAVILDISADYPKGVSEFLRSDMRFLLGSLLPWKSVNFTNIIENIVKDIAANDRNCHFVCLSLAYDRQTAGRIKKTYRIEPERFLFIENPLKLKPEQCIWLNEKLENVWRCV